MDEVFVKEGHSVTKGKILIKLESAEAEADVAAAEAVLAQAAATLKKIEAGARTEEIRRAEAAVRQVTQEYEMALKGARSQEIGAARAKAETARAEKERAKGEYERFQRLYEENVASFQEKDQAQHRHEAAKGNYEAALEQLDMLVQGTREEQIAIAKAALDRAEATLEELQSGSRVEDIDAARAARDFAKARLDSASVMLREMRVVSPMDGLVESIDVHPGDLVEPGPTIRIVDPDDLELVVYVSAALLGHLRPDQEVTLTTDSHGEESFRGRIAHIASQGEFTPRNLQTEEERVQQVFGVTITLDSADGKLRAGMTATVHLGSS